MNIVINGKATEVENGLSVEQLLLNRELNPQVVVVELNREIVDRNAFASTAISPDSELEILSFVGGGFNG